MSKRKRKLKLSSMTIILGTMLLLTFICSIIYSIKDHRSKDVEFDMVDIDYVEYDKIVDNNGRYSYEDSKYTSSFGIDVSEFTENIDWKKVKNDGVEFAYMRIGRRGATTGLLYMDDEFEINYKGATENNLKIGVYFFSQAIDEKEAREEARFVVNNLKNKTVHLPVVYDLEEVNIPNETVRIEKLTKEQFTKNALAFCDELEKYGYQPMIYTYPYWAEFLYDMDQLIRYPIWLAVYDAEVPKHDYPITIWQYTKEGRIDGINYDVDFNIMFIKK